MKKERIKNTILILLIISSLILTCRVWFNEKLLPDGYSSFIDIRMFGKIADFFGMSDKGAEQIEASIVSPSYLVAYTVKDFDHTIAVVNEQSESYVSINGFVSSTITKSLGCSANDITHVDEDAWRRALFTRGFYVDYGIEYSSSSFSKLFGVSSPAFNESISSVKRFIITAEDSLISDISVFVIDESNSRFYKISTGIDKKDFLSSLSLTSEQSSAKKRFSFFINADVATNTAGEAVFAPYIILDEEQSEHTNTISTNSIVRDSIISSHAVDKILKAFSINPKTVGKSTDANDNIIFVQSSATLKIQTDGTVLYTAAAGAKGLSLDSSSATNDISHILADAVTLLENVSSSVLDTDKEKLYMSNLTESENKISVTFDYTYNSLPVVLGGAYEGQNAVEMEFENGYLKSYKQILRRYEDSESKKTLASTYNAVNNIFSDLTLEERSNQIEDIFIAYYDDGQEGEKNPSWFLKLENIDGYKQEMK